MLYLTVSLPIGGGNVSSKLCIRYGFLLSESVTSQDPLSVSVAILHQFNILPEMYQVGYTKLFFRTGQVTWNLLYFVIFVYFWFIFIFFGEHLEIFNVLGLEIVNLDNETNIMTL